MNTKSTMSASELRRLINTAAAHLCQCSTQATQCVSSLGEAFRTQQERSEDKLRALQEAQQEMDNLRRYCDMAAMQLLAHSATEQILADAEPKLHNLLWLCKNIQGQIQRKQMIAIRIVRSMTSRQCDVPDHKNITPK